MRQFVRINFFTLLTLLSQLATFDTKYTSKYKNIFPG